MTYRGVWLGVAGVAVTAGVVVTAAAVPTPVLLFLLVVSGCAGVAAVAAAALDGSENPGQVLGPAVRLRCAVWGGATAVGVVAVVGLALLSGVLAVTVVAVLAATSPWLLEQLAAHRAVLRTHPDPDTGPAPAGATPPRADPPAFGWPSPDTLFTSTQLALMTDQQLCYLWQLTHSMVHRTAVPKNIAAVSAVRAQYLDEMARRDPTGFAQWLASGARAHSDPTHYINSTRYHQHPDDLP